MHFWLIALGCWPILTGFFVWFSSDNITIGQAHTSQCENNKNKACRTWSCVVNMIMSEAASQNHTISLEGNYLSQEADHIMIENPHSVSVNVQTICLTQCVVKGDFFIQAETYHTNIVFTFRNINFVHANFFVQNVNSYFVSVSFETSSISDVQPNPDDLGDLFLAFIDTVVTQHQLHLSHTHSLNIIFQNTSLKFSRIMLMPAHIWFTAHAISATGSVIQIKETFHIVLDVQDSIFQECGQVDQTPAIFVVAAQINFRLSDSVFDNNYAGLVVTKANPGLLNSWVQLHISNCSFTSHKKHGSGGAVQIVFLPTHTTSSASNFVNVFGSKFIRNKVMRRDIKSALGGALAVHTAEAGKILKRTILLVNISTCSFVDNEATDGGGAIFTSTGNMSLSLENSYFVCHTQRDLSHKDLFILALSNISVSNTTFANMAKNKAIPLFRFQMLTESSSINNLNFEVNCLPWYFLQTMRTLVEYENTTFMRELVLHCLACSESFYVPTNGTYNISFAPSDLDVITQGVGHGDADLECVPCPPGAECPGDDLTPKPNFWGHISGSEINFNHCPLEYCCDGHAENQCSRYNSCANNRTSTLCGTCDKTFSLSMMSVTCIPNDNCKDFWFWIMFFVGSVGYMLWYTLKDFTYKVPNIIGRHLCKLCVSSSKETQKDVYSIEKGYFGILIFYIQCASVIRLSVPVRSGVGIFNVLQNLETYTGLVLTIELSNVPADVCPIQNNTTTQKILFKFLFVISIYIAWFGFFFVSLMFTPFSFSNTREKSGSSVSFGEVLISGLTKIIKYTYGGFVNIVFFSLTCVTVAGQSVWFHDGTVSCFSLWQKYMLVFGILYAFPFPISLFSGMKLLKMREISWKQFLLGLFIPLPFLLYWLILSFYYKHQVQPLFTHRKDEEKTVAEEKIFNKFKVGYRNTDGAQYWEAVIMVRRLLLGATILIPNFLIKQCVCCILGLLNLSHHIYRLPFIHKTSNIAETISLIFLCVESIINLVKSFYIQSGLPPEGVAQDMIDILSVMETTFLPILLLSIILLEQIQRKGVVSKTN